MGQHASAWLVMLLAALAANLPFFTRRYFGILPARPVKSVAGRLVELLVYAGLVTGLGVALEARLGQVHSQGWAFYAVMACVFCTMAFPGFVWRYLKRHRPAPVAP